ncbi:MAG: polyphenol oxidase family protein [Deltaproteobacteria bacterium]|nr:polyphenol oxidase family protein [Deltaproteobacteria bacterium]
MILLQPRFVNKDVDIFFGTKLNNKSSSQEFIFDYLDHIYKITNIRRFILMHQIHGTNIQEIRDTRFLRKRNIYYNIINQTDGLYSSKKGIALTIKTADCMPVFIVSGDFAAALHMGWRGALQKIVYKYINHITNKIGIGREKIMVITGPHIRECCYSVGPEMIKQFKSEGYITSRIFTTKNKTIYLNLESTLREQIIACNIPKENIFNTSLCTSCLNTLFYSHRKGDKGRNISFIIRK